MSDNDIQITEPGRYRLRDGREVEVKVTDWPGNWPVRGHLVGTDGHLTWDITGRRGGRERASKSDIVARIDEQSERYWWWKDYKYPPYFLTDIAPERPVPIFTEITKDEFNYLKNQPDPYARLKQPELGDEFYQYTVSMPPHWEVVRHPSQLFQGCLDGYRWVRKNEPETVDLEVVIDAGEWCFIDPAVAPNSHSLAEAPAYPAFIGYVWDGKCGEVVNNKPILYRDADGALWDACWPGRTPVRPRAVRWRVEK